jgi:hypothetical protein
MFKVGNSFFVQHKRAIGVHTAHCMKVLLCAAIIIGMGMGIVQAANSVPTLNQRPFPVIEQNNAYSFLVIGHAYGRSVSSHNMPHALPAASLLANTALLSALNPDFVLMLGDVFWRMETPWVRAFKEKIADRVNVPFINALGNHDITRFLGDGKFKLDVEAYKKRFGSTYFSFVAGNDLHIVLDTVSKPFLIAGTQKAFLGSVIEQAKSNSKIKNVMFWSHYLLWAQIDDRYKGLKGTPKNQQFKTEIYPLLKDLAKTKNVYWGSGNFGEPPNSSLFYDHREKDNITLFATGIGDTLNDLILQVNVSDEGNITIKPVSLTGQGIQKIEQYDATYNQALA